MTTIRQEDFIASVADAFQFISFYHPADYIRDLLAAYDEKTLLAQVGIHITFLLSAMAIAASDRLMPAAPAHGKQHA